MPTDVSQASRANNPAGIFGLPSADTRNEGKSSGQFHQSRFHRDWHGGVTGILDDRRQRSVNVQEDRRCLRGTQERQEQFSVWLISAHAPSMPLVNDPGTLRLIFVGICAGLLSGLLGVGGGVVIVPMLVLWFGWNQKTGQATSLAAVFFIAIYGATIFAIEGKVDPLQALLIGLPALLGVLFGTRLAAKLHSDTLGLMFAGLQVTIAIVMFIR